MAITIQPLRGDFVGVVDGLRLDGPVSGAIREQLVAGLDRYAVLVIPGTTLSEDAFVDFGRDFGELEDFSSAYGQAIPKHAVRIANLDANDRISGADDPQRVSIAADALWHTDSSYRPKRARYSMLVARRLPRTGGETEFCDTRAAYDALPETMKKKVAELVGLHSIIHSRALAGFTGWTEAQRAQLPPIPQPLVMQNPRTHRRSLYLASHIFEIRGWSRAETKALIDELTVLATQPRFVHAHTWHANDVVIWDDMATMHRRASYDDLHEVRELYSLRIVEPSELYAPSVRSKSLAASHM